jgi:mono/diheme cytochrome c family protein
VACPPFHRIPFGRAGDGLIGAGAGLSLKHGSAGHWRRANRCSTCHTVPGISGADGRVGPPLVLAITGPARLNDPAYRGYAKTVHEYVIESVLEPGLFVVPGYPALTMPTWYGAKLSALALEKIASYLERQGEVAPQ